MRRMVTWAIAVTAVAATASGAVAAPKPPPKICNLVTDPKSDVAFAPARPPGVPDVDPGMDVLSADLASDAKRVTGVIRLAGSPAGGGTTTSWSVRFTVNNGLFALAAYQDAQGPKYGVWSWQPVSLLVTTARWSRSGDATGSVSGNTVTITAPSTSFGSPPPVGTPLLAVKARTERWAVAPDNSAAFPALYPNDDAPTNKTYKIGMASCVRVGG